jgi:putative ABC transport system permease protein
MGNGFLSRYLVLRTHAEPSVVLPSLRQAIQGLDPTVPLSNVAEVDDLVAQSLQRPRSLSLLIASFAVVALVLSIVGIYGVMAYYVQQHTKDIGIRLALGARAADVLSLIVGQGMAVVMRGTAIGLLTALVATRLMSSLLFGVKASDALTFVAVSALVIVVALVACFVPAKRASGLAPASVLRNE